MSRLPKMPIPIKNKSRQKQESSSALFQSALSAHLAGHLDEAERAYRRTLEIKPDYAAPLNNLGILLKDSKRLPEAEAAYRRALEIKPDYAEVHNNLGNLLKDSKRLPEAEAAYRRALEIKPNAVHLTTGVQSNFRFISSPPFFDGNFLTRLLTTRGLLRPLLLV